MKKLSAYLLFTLFVFQSVNCEAQQRTIDSLYKIIAGTKNDTILVTSLTVLGDTYYNLYPDSLLILSQKAISLIDQKIGSAGKAEKRSFMKNMADAQNGIGTYFYNKGDVAEAMDFFLRSLKLREELGDRNGIAYSLNNIGFIYQSRGNISKGLEYYYKSLKIQEQLKNKNGIALLLNNIAHLYRNQGIFHKALENFQNSLKIWTETGDTHGVALALNNIGSIYQKQGDMPKAIENFNKSLKIREEIKDNAGISISLSSIGSVYYTQKKYDSAIVYFNRSLAIRQKTGDKSGIADCLNRIGNIYLKENNFSKASDYALQALRLSKEIGHPESIQAAAGLLQKIYSQTGKWKEAYSMFELFSQMKDSLKNEENLKKSISSAINFEFEKKATADSVKNAEEQLLKNSILEAKESQLKEEKTQRYALYGGLALTLVFAGFAFNRFKISNKQNKIIQKQKSIADEKNRELERLSIVASETENVILILDADGTLEWVNESFVKLNAITMEELKKLKGDTIYEISNNKEIRNIVEKSVREKKPVVYESLNKTPDGKTVWESTTLTPIFDESGKLKKLIIIDTDVTDRKEAEEIIREKNKDITDSIHYAQRIQRAVLASDSLLNDNLPEHFVFFRPKDIVSGDFYWASVLKNGNFAIVTADSTGHGVPGAFMSLLNISFLNESTMERGLTDPSEILNYTRSRLIQSLSHDGSSEGGKDGMDCTICCFDFKKLTLDYSAANNSFYILRNGELIDCKANKMPVGKSPLENEPFTFFTKDLQKGDIVYTLTDGLPDQFGGAKGKKFKYKQLEETLIKNSHLPMKAQSELLEETFNKWKDKLEQVDDVLLIGIKI